MTFGLQLFQFILSGLTTGSTYALIAIGFSLIHNATGRILPPLTRFRIARMRSRTSRGSRIRSARARPTGSIT